MTPEPNPADDVQITKRFPECGIDFTRANDETAEGICYLCSMGTIQSKERAEQITRQAGEIERLTAENAKLVEERDEIKKVATHYSDSRMNGHYQQVAGEILAIVARS